MSTVDSGQPTDLTDRNVRVVEQCMRALQQKDYATVVHLLDANVTLVQPLTLSGKATPDFRADGKDAVLAYVQNVFANMAQIQFVNQRLTQAQDAAIVFLEASGDFLTASDVPYNNVYIFKFSVHNGMITEIVEYANPVTFALTFGVPPGK